MLPSSTTPTCSRPASAATLSRRPLSAYTEVRDATRSPSMRARAALISSVIPSLRASSSGIPPRLANGSTATERRAAAAWPAAASPSACANRVTLGNRSPGSLASARVTASSMAAGRSGRTMVSGGTRSAT